MICKNLRTERIKFSYIHDAGVEEPKRGDVMETPYGLAEIRDMSSFTRHNGKPYTIELTVSLLADCPFNRKRLKHTYQ